MDKNVIFSSTRLYFKEFSTSDAADFFDLNNDPEVLKFTGDTAFQNIKETEQFIEEYDHYKKYGFGRWSVFLKEDNTYIGFCGLKYSEDKEEVDIGFRFHRKCWNKGYATEAAERSLAFGKALKLDKIVARANQENAASLRVIEKLGMKFQYSFEENQQKWLQYELNI